MSAQQPGLWSSNPPLPRRGKPRSREIWRALATELPELSLRLQTLVRLISDGACSRLPTPVCRDYRSPGKPGHGRLQASRGEPLPETLGVRVHPDLCLWMQGFPEGWLDGIE